MSKRDYPSAVRELQAAIAANPSGAAEHRVLGQALLLEGKDEEAVDALRTAVALNPQSGLAHHYLGTALVNTQQLAEAKRISRGPPPGAQRAGYMGLHRLPVLIAGCAAEKNAIGRSANTDIVRLGAPLCFGRKTQVVDLSRKRFAFGRDRKAAYRIPFLFIENGIVKVYYLQPRKSAGLTIEEFGMMATIVKCYLLETEFFGLTTDIEFVDLSAPEEEVERQVRQYNLDTLKLWSDKRLEERLSLIAQALDWAAASGQVEKRRRVMHAPEPEMPLFD